jgi:putative transposase
MLERLRSVFAKLCEQWDCELLECNGEPDHVHLLLSVNPKTAPSVLVNNFKTVSSRLIRKEFKARVDRFYRKPVFWSRSYCVISCGGAPLSVLKQYVENQAGVD